MKTRAQTRANKKEQEVKAARQATVDERRGELLLASTSSSGGEKTTDVAKETEKNEAQAQLPDYQDSQQGSSPMQMSDSSDQEGAEEIIARWRLQEQQRQKEDTYKDENSDAQ